MTRSQMSDQLRAAPEPPKQRHSRGAAGVALAILVTAGFASGCGSANASTEQSNLDGSSETAHSAGRSDPADEICEEMVATAVAGQLGTESLIGDPVLAKSGTTTTCTYKVTDGSLAMSVGEQPSNDAARAVFDEAKATATGAERVPNLGESAFTDASGTTVTVKDDKVLTVDPTDLPAGNDKTQIAQSLSFAVLTCWTH